MDKSIDNIVDTIMNSPDYKDCIDIKKKMLSNDDINSKIKEIKKLQKQYLRTNDISIKERLDVLEEELNNIPIYNIYNQKLNSVNEMIDLVNDEINDYFYKLLNEED